MDYDYSPFNPYIWSIFGAFCLATYLIVTLFHRRNPDYPYKNNNEPGPTADEKELDQGPEI